MQIRLDNVSYIYQHGSPLALAAIRDIDLFIPSGQFVVLLGHSGCGKSTLAQVITGLLEPQKGRVEIDSQAKEKDHIFKRVGLVFQYSEQQFFAETVHEEVAFAAKNMGLPQQKITETVESSLQKVGLNPELFADRSPFNLSGGEKRRVAAASVLAMQPDVLIFDEPTAGLDANGRDWMCRLAKSEHRAGTTIIWITHNMDEAAMLAERILVMNNGSIALDGSPRQVFAQEELLASLGLEVPVAAALLRKLRMRNFPVPAQGLSVEEAFREINQALLQRGDRP